MDAPIEQDDSHQRKLIFLQQGDKITKKPVQYGHYLVIRGRSHIHLFDVQTFTSHYLPNSGEDNAEKLSIKVKE